MLNQLRQRNVHRVALAYLAGAWLLIQVVETLTPDSSYANGWLGYFAEQEGDLQAAALYRERAVAGAVDSNLYLQRALSAQFLARLGRFDEAEALARYAIDRDPACVMCVNLLSYVLRQAGLHREAAETLESFREWHELTPPMYWNLGVAWLVAGAPGKSLEYFEKTWPELRDKAKLFAWHDLGRLDEFEAALEGR